MRINSIESLKGNRLMLRCVGLNEVALNEKELEILQGWQEKKFTEPVARGQGVARFFPGLRHGLCEHWTL